MGSRKRVVILGAGISGLAAIKSCLEEGLEPVCLEQFDDIGGIWYYTERYREGQGARAFDTLTTNSPKDLFCYSDFPYPRDFPPFPTHEMVHKYLNLYCEKFHLRKHIHFKTKVLHIQKSDDYDVTGRWEVEMTDASKAIYRDVYDSVIVCSGFSEAWIPEVKGLETFKGSIEHSKTFKDGAKYKAKRVLVVGTGNSAGDMAVVVSQEAKQVYLSVGKGTYIVPRLLEGGQPLGYVTQRRSNIRNKNTLGNVVCAIANSRLNHSAAGITSADKVPDLTQMINDLIYHQIACGRVKIAGRLVSVGENEAELEDGTILKDIDAILFATGYRRGQSFLSDEARGGKDKLYLYKMTFPLTLPHQTLALIGCFQSAATVTALVEVQGRLAARVFSGRHKLPPYNVMMKDVERWNQSILQNFGCYKYKIPNLVIRDEMAAELGVTPSRWDLIKAGPRLAYLYYYGPAFPYYYRLWGPHPWCGAKKAIDAALRDGYMPTPVGRNKPLAPKSVCSYANVGLSFLVVMVIAALGKYFGMNFWLSSF
ncbi:flavin-containing monooxygenase 5-like [Haliotis rufescens]|uniref:flavin-containing monooxygenase 5-like n=1 Tax=Haliotis rufescens TaxID=6454 RepID=UPI00201F3890|nr:flavin-containing monooxygenase 5-like [Haliotis rufescens]